VKQKNTQVNLKEDQTFRFARTSTRRILTQQRTAKNGAPPEK